MKLATQISLGFFIVISIDLLDSYTNYSLTKKVNTNAAFLTISEAIIRNSSTLNKGIIDVQSAFRGYLLTNDESFLVPYYDNSKAIFVLINQEKKLISSSPSQRRKLDSILLLQKSWLGYANLLIETKRKATNDTSFAKEYQHLFNTLFKKQVGKNYTDQITNIFRLFDRNEYKIREDRRYALANSIKQTETFSIFFSSLTIIIGLSGAIYLVRKISKRIDGMVKLAENISQGDFTKVNDNKMDELSSLSKSLNSMSNKLSHNISELKKRNDELDQFAYVVSHDLKAPARGIYNVMQWIEEDFAENISPKMQKYLEIIPERIQRMENLIDGLLDYARIGSEKQTKEEVDVAILVNEVAEEIASNGHQMYLSELPKLWTEKLLLRQVFSNLISNAVKYTPADNGKINISCIEKGNLFEFTVTDNGVGIEREYHEKIFVIFQTLREKNDKESTGVGLAIVKKIVESKNCSIKINSSKGNGSSFIFTWPKN
ncbi:MAG TPA: ATP-binding protein [Mucilaginibacter sp.]|jgi:signal transduction histidine kinase